MDKLDHFRDLTNCLAKALQSTDAPYYGEYTHMHKDMEIFYLLEEICGYLYPSKQTSGVGWLWGDVGSLDNVDVNASKLPNSTLVPLSENDTSEAILENIIDKACLYSDLFVITLPNSLGALSISYSGKGHFSPSGGQSTFVDLNQKFIDVLKNGSGIILPSSIHYTYEGINEHEVREKSIHLLSKDPLNDYLRLNPSKNFSATDLENLIVYKNIILPYIEGLSLQEYIQISKNETDSFVKFNYFLKSKLREIKDCSKEQAIALVLEEIEYETSNLRIEAERLKKLKCMNMANIALFTISLPILLIPELAEIRSFAALLGSMNLYRILKGNFEKNNEIIKLKKSDFYIPYILNSKKS